MKNSLLVRPQSQAIGLVSANVSYLGYVSWKLGGVKSGIYHVLKFENIPVLLEYNRHDGKSHKSISRKFRSFAKLLLIQFI